MTKFGNAEKTGPSGFSGFQKRNNEGAKLIDLKIQGVLRHEKY
jgi:hypothetical protein